MSVEAAQARLTRGLKDLRAQWLQVRSQWHDPVAEAFERSFFTSLELDLRATLGGLDQLRGVLSQARHDCR